ncbi:MAG: leader peptidase (prepilin peptidase) / N-methyltransferase [Solirubrobacteraceae bacterium]|jgi:leader peptidase (prepilin peptidase)/N-methyltransferase|nr:leader peptidase (prepilin peptidase) / N-methyltransferase [Solirubrobacteraceae bacterium]
MALAVIAALVGGLIVGSFLNVVAYRLPRGESLASPGSRCPGCGTPIRPYDNVPVVSWLVLRGRCRHCGTSISARYPLVELTTGVLYAAVVAFRHGTLDIVLGLLLVTVLVPVVLIDLEHRLIPNRITLPAAVAAVVAALIVDPGFVPEQLIAAAAAGGFFLLAVLAKPGGMGMGDVKLAAVLGLYLGRAVAPAVLIGLISGVAVGAVIIARKGAREGRRTRVPFGPFLALGAVVALFAGDALVDRYTSTF